MFQGVIMPPPSVFAKSKMTFAPYNTTQINYKGLCEFQNLYKMMHDWLVSRKFMHYPSGSPNIEDYFQEYLLSPGGPKNNWIWWRTMRKENAMFNYYIEVNFQCLVLSTKEVVIKGEKMKLNDGEVSIWITGFLQVDPNAQWTEKGNSLLSHAYDLFAEKEFVTVIDDHESDICMYCGELFERAKQYLHLMTAMPLQKPFHPESANPNVQGG
jgi:hypothetical protein